MKSKQFKDFILLWDSVPFSAFSELQGDIKKRGWVPAISNKTDSYYFVIKIDDVNAASFTARMLSDNVCKVIDKIYSTEYMKKKYGTYFPFSIVKDILTVFDEGYFSHIKLRLISTFANENRSEAISRITGYKQLDGLYRIPNPQNKSQEWCTLFYKGSYGECNLDIIPRSTYEEKFGNLIFTYNLSDPPITNTKYLFKDYKPKRILEIGTFEGKFAIWVSEWSNNSVTTIDPHSGSEYDVHQVLYNRVYRNFIRNVKRSGCHINHISERSFDALVKLNYLGKTFDFIYVDGSHTSREVLSDIVLSYNLLEKGGIMLLDDSTSWKARDYITGKTIHDVAEAPRLAIDNFIHIHWKDIRVINLPASSQVAFMKL